VLACGAWREEREVEDDGELVGEEKDDRELDGEDEDGGGSTGQRRTQRSRRHDAGRSRRRRYFILLLDRRRRGRVRSRDLRLKRAVVGAVDRGATRVPGVV
jgi:hypothetical protein